MTSIPAAALTLVDNFKGPCVLVLSKRSITIKRDEAVIGTWPFECIRRFHCQDLNYFSFTSGRRGPFGVCDYTFKLQEDDLQQLQAILSQHTGARFDSPRGTRLSTISSDPSSLSSSYSQISLHTSTQPGYTQMTINGFGDSHKRSLSPGYSATLPSSPLTTPISPCLQIKKERTPSYDTLDRVKLPPFPSTIDGIAPLVASDSPTINGTPASPLTKREIKQIKKYDKEPLVNKSPTIHTRRKAEYIDIDLPDTASEGSTGSAIYDFPSSIPEQPVYDVPPPPKPLDQNTYDVPASIRREMTDSHSSSSSPASLSPSHRALPHLPTDYENVQPPPKKLGVREYVNIEFKEPSDSGLYMEVPLQNDKPKTKSLTNLYADIPEWKESQLSIRRVESDQPVSNPGERIAKELAEEGYEFINPAMLPALRSPPVAPSVQTVVEESVLIEDDEYVEVQRVTPVFGKELHMLSPGVTTEERNKFETNVALCNVPSRSKRLSDGYEEISDVVRELQSRRNMSSPKPERTSSETNEEDEELTLQTVEDPSIPISEIPNLHKQPSRNSSTNSESSTEVVKLNFTGDVKEYPDGYHDNDSDEDDFEDVASISGNKSKTIVGPAHSPSQPKTIVGPAQPVSVNTGRSSKHTVPTAVSSPDTSHAMLLRKRSLTVGDPLDNKESKKHTYVNVPDDTTTTTPPPSRSLSIDLQSKKKPPMPLPRPSTIKNIIDCNHNNNSNKVKSLVRQFSDI